MIVCMSSSAGMITQGAVGLQRQLQGRPSVLLRALGVYIR